MWAFRRSAGNEYLASSHPMPTVQWLIPTRVDTETAFHPNGDGTKIATRLSSGLGAGTHPQSYRVISGDSHPMVGVLRFADLSRRTPTGGRTGVTTRSEMMEAVPEHCPGWPGRDQSGWSAASNTGVTSCSAG